MKKFMMDAKAALGTAPKTEDKDYDSKASNVKGIEKALSDYKSAMEKMKSAGQSVVSAMEAMEKAFEAMGKAEDATDAIKETAKSYEEAVKKSKDDHYAAFKKAIEEHENISAVKDLGAECQKLESKRSSVMAEYDTYREDVRIKEIEYKKKNKDLTESKHYDTEVAKRDSLKADFEKADKEFKDKYAELEKVKIASYTTGMAEYLKSTASFLGAVEKELNSVASKVN